MLKSAFIIYATAYDHGSRVNLLNIDNLLLHTAAVCKQKLILATKMAVFKQIDELRV